MEPFDRIKDDAIAIAVVATDVKNIKEMVQKIEGKLDRSLEKAEIFKVEIATANKRVDATEKDIRGLHKRVTTAADDARADLDMHEAHCVARGFVADRLAKPSRNPKDTPKEIKKPNANEIALPTIPKWLWWTGIVLGVALAAFAIAYAKFKAGL